MTQSIANISGLLALPLLLLTSCDDTLFSVQSTHSIEGSDFCAMESLFKSDCVSCHSTSSPAGDLDLESDPHSHIVDQFSTIDVDALIVSPGVPEESLLYLKMVEQQSAAQGGTMPPDR